MTNLTPAKIEKWLSEAPDSDSHIWIANKAYYAGQTDMADKIINILEYFKGNDNVQKIRDKFLKENKK